MSDASKQRESHPDLASFAVMSPKDDGMMNGEVNIIITAMVGLSKADNSFKPAVMLTFEYEGKKHSIPLPADYAAEIGVQLIEAGITSKNDVNGLRYDRDTGKPLSELFDRLHAIALMGMVDEMSVEDE